MIALVHRLEQQQSLNEEVEVELQAARAREKSLLAHQKILEDQSKEQRESIQDLVLNISQLSGSSSILDRSTLTSNINLQDYCSSPNDRNRFGKFDTFLAESYVPDDEVAQSLPIRFSTGALLHRQMPFICNSVGRKANGLSEYDGLITSRKKLEDVNTKFGSPYTTPIKTLTHPINTKAAQFSRSQGVLIGVVRPNNSRPVLAAADGDCVKMKSPISAREAKVKKKRRRISRLLNFCKGGIVKD